MIKLAKKGLPFTISSAKENINDIAGVRVVCSYIDDVYRVVEIFERQKDVEILKKQDYIKEPNYNGYRSLHLDTRIPVYLSDRTEYVVAEIQLRTIAMDFWASLEHKLRYKKDLDEDILEKLSIELTECALKCADLDQKMENIKKSIEKNALAKGIK